MERKELPEDMQSALSEFDREAQNIVGSLCSTLNSQEPPEVIYHYTDDNGLKGILETGQIWLSDIFNLNDPSELSHGFSHAANILARKADSGPPETKEFAAQFEKFGQLGLEQSAHYFVCAFSSHGDELGQWRAYADNGRGYALGFDGKSLEGAFVKEGGVAVRNNNTFPVTYNDSTLAKLHAQVVDRMFHLISLPKGRKLEKAVLMAYLRDLSTALSVHVLSTALFFKHEAYANESEYRFLQVHRGDQPVLGVKRRYRSYEQVKYMAFDWKRLCPNALKRIVVGPAADQVKSVKFAMDCLAAFHVANIPIVCSSIPYRAIDRR